MPDKNELEPMMIDDQKAAAVNGGSEAEEKFPQTCGLCGVVFYRPSDKLLHNCSKAVDPTPAPYPGPFDPIIIEPLPYK